jgi:hypothetical protein
MRIAVYKVVFLVAVLMALFGPQSCRKTNTMSVGGIVKFSVDTLKFDTVFTTQGSYTNGLLIYNPQNEDIILSSVRLQNPSDTFFHLNVDGYSGANISNIRVRAHDSVYVFATIKINPNDSLTPFYITDNLIATVNGRDFSIPFTAYGQNAYFIVGDSIGSNTTWHTDKPYVVIHYAVVGPTATLTIPAKCRIYMHQDARIFVYGKLNIGDTTSSDSVVFQGDRLDRAYFGYQGYPGEWGGLYFVSGSQGTISHTVIKNGGGSTASYLGFQTQSAALEVDSAASVTLRRTVIKNSIGYGILDFQGSVNAASCLVHTTGAQAFITLQGGNAVLNGCTFANFGSFAVTHADYPTVSLVNYLPIGNGQYISGPLHAVMNNCVVYGSLDSELLCDSLSGAAASAVLNHCLLKTGSYIENFVSLDQCLRFTSPIFKDSLNADFHLSTGSPAIGAADPLFSPGYDLDGKPFSGDIGCYQH